MKYKPYWVHFKVGYHRVIALSSIKYAINSEPYCIRCENNHCSIIESSKLHQIVGAWRNIGEGWSFVLRLENLYSIWCHPSLSFITPLLSRGGLSEWEVFSPQCWQSASWQALHTFEDIMVRTYGYADLCHLSGGHEFKSLLSYFFDTIIIL